MAAPWLRAFVCADGFFTPCSKHSQHSTRDASLNYWDISTQQELCGVCLAEHPANSVIQIRRSSYHDVCKVGDLSRLADIAGIQPYVINGSKVIFLKRRPQPRPPKGAVGASQCTVCGRHLQDISHFCSLQCKLDGCATPLPHAPPLAVEKPASKPAPDSRSSGSSGPDTPQHALPPHHPPHDSGSSSDSDSGCDSHTAKRRKRAPPLRSPLD